MVCLKHRRGRDGEGKCLFCSNLNYGDISEIGSLNGCAADADYGYLAELKDDSSAASCNFFLFLGARGVNDLTSILHSDHEGTNCAVS